VPQQDPADSRQRLDKWLWCVRLYKSRGLATQAVAGGRVKVNGDRVKPSHALRLGDRVSLSRDEAVLLIDVLAFPVRRGPAPEARACYAETPESAAQRALHSEQRRLDAMSRPWPDTRPDKRERRQLEKLRRNNQG